VAAQILQNEMGIRVTGVSDHSASYFDEAGLPVTALIEHCQKHGSLAGWSTNTGIASRELLTSPCDILVPAAVERVIDENIARELKCKIIAEGANGPTTPGADRVLSARPEIFVLPDILCNSGGVIVSYFEWVQGLQRLTWTEEQVNDQLRRLLHKAFNQVVDRSKREQVSMRLAATAIGVERVAAGKALRGLFP
jgi:glutamate dehydrogenase (NAD(P)+)